MVRHEQTTDAIFTRTAHELGDTKEIPPETQRYTI